MKGLVIAGGLPQITLIRQLKERGIQTILIDGSPFPLARAYADQFYQVNILILRRLKESRCVRKWIF